MLFFNTVCLGGSIFVILFTMVGLIQHKPETPFKYFVSNTIIMGLGCIAFGMNLFYILDNIRSW